MIPENLVHCERREAEGRFVEHQKIRPAHQGAADRQHLLFAAGKRAALLPVSFLEARKKAVNPFNVAGYAVLLSSRE